ncbi:hypothetical protein [uncultured Jatrophihabitans sp.]|uniref:hypothetical protein n=1 Tax=uncultured Jatrophihabitans sp. TaxID=1610747 RepID=UPI0035CA0ACC
MAALIGRDDDARFVAGVGDLAATAARSAASSYTRGVGFEDEDQIPVSLVHVITNRAIRIAGNAQQLLSETRDGVTMNYGLASQGWTLDERRALDEYRRKTASL